MASATSVSDCAVTVFAWKLERSFGGRSETCMMRHFNGTISLLGAVQNQHLLTVTGSGTDNGYVTSASVRFRVDGDWSRPVPKAKMLCEYARQPLPKFVSPHALTESDDD